MLFGSCVARWVFNEEILIPVLFVQNSAQRFKLQPEKQYKTGRQGWLNEGNEIEPEGSKHAVKKRLNRGRLGWLSKDEIELEGSKHEIRKELNRGRQCWLNEDNEIEPGESKKQLNKGMLG